MRAGLPEIVYLARVADLPRLTQPPVVGAFGFPVGGAERHPAGRGPRPGRDRLHRGGFLDGGERLPRGGGWADVGNLHVTGRYRCRGVATWLLGQAAGWLRLAQVERLLDYAWLDGTDPGGLDYSGTGHSCLPPASVD